MGTLYPCILSIALKKLALICKRKQYCIVLKFTTRILLKKNLINLWKNLKKRKNSPFKFNDRNLPNNVHEFLSESH